MLISIAIAKLRTWLLYRDTIRELEGLSDRLLADVGTTRSNIRDFARNGDT